MSDAQSLSVEILEQIRSDLKEGLDGLRGEAQQTNHRLDQTNHRLDQTIQRLDQTNQRLEDIKEMQDLLVGEHRKTNQRLDFFAEELVRMRTRDNERISALENAVAELQRKVG